MFTIIAILELGRIGLNVILELQIKKHILVSCQKYSIIIIITKIFDEQYTLILVNLCSEHIGEF